MNTILNGDSLDVLKTLEDESVDLLCTDPPYAIGFMGKAWDKALPDIGIFKECFRVLKPGAFAFVMSAPRSDVCSRMAILLEDAGFQINFTPIYWTYASGFPKAMNIGKAVDKRNGVQGEEYIRPDFAARSNKTAQQKSQVISGQKGVYHKIISDLDGSYGGFQLKPAVEVVIVAMKPLSEKTYVDQALKNGKGITWLDDVRIPYKSDSDKAATATGHTGVKFDPADGWNDNKLITTESKMDLPGRFPANLLVEDNMLNDHSRFFSLDSWAETLPFLAVPKASKREKNEGLDSIEPRVSIEPITNLPSGKKVEGDKMARFDEPKKNHHPTVKPLKLMSYLITLGSRPGDVVLDPFLGSGTTAIAAKQLGRNYVGIEREAEYVEIATARLNAATS